MAERVLCAPDKFRGSFSAAEAAQAMASGVIAAGAVARQMPLADGGEGTLAALAATFPLIEEVAASDPIGQPIVAEFRTDSTGAHALVESATMCGQTLLSKEARNPLNVGTRGLGLMLAALVARGFKRISVGLGGSTTNDGGAGMARALGVEFLDSAGREVGPLPGGLDCVHRVEAGSAALDGVKLAALCDVLTPLLGDRGCTRLFATQKGARPEDLAVLEGRLEKLVAACERSGLRPEHDAPGAGAAGGLGFGLATFLGAELRPGAHSICEMLGLESEVERADLVLTGEGSFDRQSLEGKVVSEVARLCQTHGKPLVVLAGRVEPGLALPGRARIVELRASGGNLAGLHDLRSAAQEAVGGLELGAIVEPG